MNAKTAAIFLRLHRPDRSGAEDGRVAKAVRFAERDPALREALARQREFDHDTREAIRALIPPDTLQPRLRELRAHPAAKKLDWRTVLKQPAFLGVVIALIALGWVLARAWRERQENFPGREAVEHMLALNDKLESKDFEQVSMSAAELGDWLMLKKLDGYAMPPEFGAFRVLGCRVFRPEGHAVAQVAAQKDAENQMLFYIFRASDFGVKLEEKHWRIFTENEWAAAARTDGANVCMVAFKGDEDDMEKFLATLKRRK